MANFYRRFVEAAGRYPDNVAVEVQRQAREGENPPPERFSYREMRRMSDALAAWLSKDAPAGARCAILAANGPRWLTAYLGAIGAGDVAVPLDTNFNAEQVAKLLKDSGSALLFVDAGRLPAAREAVEGLDVRLFLLERCPDSPGAPDFDSVISAEAGAFSPVEAGDDETAVIVYTSGTTSDPKGVMLTHGGLAAELDAAFRIASVTHQDAILGVLPLFHVLSQMANLFLPLSVGARTVFLETVSSAELLRALRERGITFFVCVPQFFYLIHERIQKEAAASGALTQAGFGLALKLCALGRRLGMNLGKLFFGRIHRMLGPDLRYLVTGGARMDPGICRDFADMGFELLQAYGLSETTGAVFVTPPGGNVIGSVGKPMHGVKAKLLDAKPSDEAEGVASAPRVGASAPRVGAAAPRRRLIGEVAVSAPMVMKGYYNRPDATAAVLKDGWLNTGDLGYFDRGGNLFIVGRSKEVIVLSSGKNIYPEEIEAHYLKSPFIKEICVVGLRSLPGEPFSERLHGVVVPNFEVLRERRIVNTTEVLRFDIEGLSTELPPTKRILGYELWQQDLPRTTTRKIKRFEVERRVRERQAARAKSGEESAAERDFTPQDREWLARPDVARAVELIRAAIKGKRRAVHPRDNIELDLGLDSVERVELLGVLERELGADIEDWAAAQVFTVRELVDTVLAHAGSSKGRAPSRPTWDALLRAETTDPEALDITRPRNVSDRVWWVLFRLVRYVARLLYRLEIVGVEKLPKQGPFIISPNHQSFLDGPVVIAALPFRVLRNLFYVGTSEIFGAGIMRRVARSLRLVPIDPDANMVAAMKAGAYGLSKGRVLLLFPEGERSIDGTPKVFKKGAAILSSHLRVPVVPVGLEGFYEAWPRGGVLRLRGKLRISFGDPIPPPEQVDGDAGYAKMTAELKERVISLTKASAS